VEATGVVTEVGDGVTGLSPGTRVTFFPYFGRMAPSRQRRRPRNVVPVPDSVPDEVAAPNAVQTRITGGNAAPRRTATLRRRIRRCGAQTTRCGFVGVVDCSPPFAETPPDLPRSASCAARSARKQLTGPLSPTVPAVSHRPTPDWVRAGAHGCPAEDQYRSPLDPVRRRRCKRAAVPGSPPAAPLIVLRRAWPIEPDSVARRHDPCTRRFAITRADDQSLAYGRICRATPPPTWPAPFAIANGFCRSTLTSPAIYPARANRRRGAPRVPTRQGRHRG